MISAGHPAGGHSHLYNSLRSYLHNQSREQPIIGLSSITEVRTYGHTVYFCDVCCLRITKDDIRNHIMGSIHKYNYISSAPSLKTESAADDFCSSFNNRSKNTKSHHAHRWRSSSDLTLLARPLMNFAKKIEKREGTGDIQVLHVDEVVFKEIASSPVPDALSQIKTFKNQRDPNAFHLHVNSSLAEGNKSSADWQQEAGTTHGTVHLPTSGCFLPTQYVSTTASLAKCSMKFEPQTVSASPSPDSSLPVQPFSQWQDVPFQVHSPAPAITQHINQYQPVIPGKNQRYMMPSENQCLTKTRTVSVMRPLRSWIPVTLPSQSDEDAYEVIQSFGVSCKTHILCLDQPSPNEAPSLSTNRVVPDITQDLSNRPVHFRNESLSADLESDRDVETTSIIKSTRKHMLTGAQEPIHTCCEAHVEPQSDPSAEESSFLSPQNPVEQPCLTVTHSRSNHFKSKKDILKKYDGQKPLIGLRAIIKCQTVDGSPPPCFYLCQLCSIKLKKKKKILSHLTNLEHQRNYIKVLHPQLLPKKRKPHVTCEMLEHFAMQLEKQDGRGHIKVMRLSACLFNEMLNRDYHQCMNMLNCGAGVEWRSDLLSFKERKTTGPSQTAKRPAESMLPPNEKWTTQQMSKKMKMVNPNKVFCANRVKTVFKVSLSLQEGPIIIERMPLRDTTSVAPEIEDQTSASTTTDDNALSVMTSTGSEVHMCTPGIPDVSYATQQHPDGDTLTQTSIPTLSQTHSEMIPQIDGRTYEDQFMHPAQYAYQGQFDPSQMGEPSLTPRACGSEGEAATVTHADWPVQDWSFQTDQWDHPQCAGYMQF